MPQSRHLVVGLGVTGLSIARFLKRRKIPFAVFDTRQQPTGMGDFQIEFPEVEVFLEHFPEHLYPELDEIICSPGVSLETPFLQEAMRQGISIIGDIECMVREVDVPIIAITGTNGKSTVTTLVGEMAKEAGLRVAVAGNIGLPVLDIHDIGVEYDLWVLELSSFQLELIHSLSPIAATVLNVTPDHLDRHHTFDAYVKTKQRIYQQAKTIVYNRCDKNTLAPSSLSTQTVTSYGLDAPEAEQWGLLEKDDGYYLAHGKDALLAVDALRIKGKHNWLNALAACALAYAYGIDFKAMREVLKRFSGLPHRCQWVRRINDVEWINDSKGTNVGATVSAIAGIGDAIAGKIILIAGGQGKGASFDELKHPVETYVRSVVLIGEDARKIEAALNDAVPISLAQSLEAAVAKAQAEARAGDVVLLSPACASFDMFRDFNHRGDDFITAVQAL